MSLFEPSIAEPHDQSGGTDEAAHQTALCIDYYTDPLCSWSWAFEPQWRRLCYEYAGSLRWHYHMGGLIADWQSYADPFNDIRNPAQMGPQWFQVRELTGMPLDERIWQTDPPASSYPACIAVKAAERQGQVVVESYLRRLREAVMIEQRNIARQDVLLAVASETANELHEFAGRGTFDITRFRQDLSATETIEAFRTDLRDAAYQSIGRFPTLIIRRVDGHGIILVGYRPYEVLTAAIMHLAPDLQQRQTMPVEDIVVAYAAYWQRFTTREIAEMISNDIDQTTQLLETLVARDTLNRSGNLQSEVPMYTFVSHR